MAIGYGLFFVKKFIFFFPSKIDQSKDLDKNIFF
jgi:hypothetical protein